MLNNLRKLLDKVRFSHKFYNFKQAIISQKSDLWRKLWRCFGVLKDNMLAAVVEIYLNFL